MTATWHVPPNMLGNYLDDAVDQPTASSVEAHLIGCATCRNALADRSDPTVVTDSWISIGRAIDDEFESRVERVASRAGVSDRDVRTLAPTLSLQGAWMAATLLALLAAALLARHVDAPSDGLARMLFLTVASLAPLIAVVTALSAASEPAPEIARATPASRLRTAAVRAGTVMVAAIAIGLIASAVLPGGLIEGVAWLLPAVALSGVGALSAGRVSPTTAIGWLGCAWVVIVAVAAQLADDRLAAFRPGAQGLYLAVAVVAAAAIALRPDLLNLRSQP
ncbi:MAG: zf-HC2 domain-containing protein [Microthrixaceae bacterium]